MGKNLLPLTLRVIEGVFIIFSLLLSLKSSVMGFRRSMDVIERSIIFGFPIGKDQVRNSFYLEVFIFIGYILTHSLVLL